MVTRHYNSFPQTAIGCAPYQALFGHAPKPGFLIKNTKLRVDLDNICEKYQCHYRLFDRFGSVDEHPARQVRKITEARTIANAERVMAKINETRKVPSFKLGDQVLVRKESKEEGFQKTLSHDCEGPYEIIDVQPGKNVYKLNWPSGSQKRDWVNGERLMIYTSRPKDMSPSVDTGSEPGKDASRNIDQTLKQDNKKKQVETRKLPTRSNRGKPPERLITQAYIDNKSNYAKLTRLIY